MAFLLGICRGLKDSNEKNIVAHSMPAHLQKLRQEAVAAGLENPATILRNELDAARIHLMVQQKSYERRYLPAPSQLVLQDAVDVDMDGEEETQDGMNVFQFDENGVIV